MKDNHELRQMTVEELEAEILSLRKDQFGIRLKKASGSLDKTHVVKNIRRAIARVKTIMTERQGNSHVK